MTKYLSALVTSIAILLLIPSGLILASWNAIPGDSLYGVKRDMEGVAFAMTKDTPIATAFSLKFTDRRFNEATILLAKKGSTIGYTYLVAEAQKTKDIIIEKDDAQSASELVAKIDTYQAAIQQKQESLERTPATPPVAIVTTPIPTAFYAPRTPEAVPTPPPTQQPQPSYAAVTTQPPPVIVAESTPVVIENLKETNDDLEKIKQDLERKLPEKSQGKGHGNQGEKNKENKD